MSNYYSCDNCGEPLTGQDLMSNATGICLRCYNKEVEA